MHRVTRRTLPYLASPFWLTLALALSLPLAEADEILMRDGSRLLGTVVKRENGTLTFKTSYAGDIKVKWDEVAEVTTEKPMEFLLSDESIVTGTHVINSPNNLVIEGESGEPDQTLAQDAVTYVNPESWRKGEGYKLSGRVNFAFSRQRGNTDKDEIAISSQFINFFFS